MDIPVEASTMDGKERIWIEVAKNELQDLSVGEEVTLHMKAKVKGLSEQQRREWDEEKDKPGKEETTYEITFEYDKKDVKVAKAGEKNPFSEMAEEDA